VIFSHEQTAGKGQRGKKWASAKHAGIAISIVIDPSHCTVATVSANACTAVTFKGFPENMPEGRLKSNGPMTCIGKTERQVDFD
jgi:BirA family biotin operon repressor/biotin-[acetyl-CoA-carboxylase] ligase